MKKYFIAVAALAFWLHVTEGSKRHSVLVEEESIAVAEAAPMLLLAGATSCKS